MHTPVLFADLLIIFLVSVPVAFLCLRLKLSLLVGLMITGIVIGPYGLGLIEELEAIEILAEIGVVLAAFYDRTGIFSAPFARDEAARFARRRFAGQFDDCGDDRCCFAFRAQFESSRCFSVF